MGIAEWGGLVAFVFLSGGLVAIWKAVSSGTKEVKKDLKDEIRGAEGRQGERIGRLDQRLDERISRVDNRLTGMLQTVLGKVIPSKAFAANSPLHLTEEGERISSELGAKAWASAEVEKLNPPDRAGGYELQGYCFTYVNEAELPVDLTVAIREVADREDVDEGEVRSVLAIELRDALLALQRDESGQQPAQPPERST